MTLHQTAGRAEIREDLHSHIRAVAILTQNVKASVTELRTRDEPGLQTHQPQCEALLYWVQRDLLPVLEKLRGRQPAIGTITDPLLEQALVDEEGERLAVIESEVKEIVKVMREVDQLLTAPIDDLNKPQYVACPVATATGEAASDLSDGTIHLEGAATTGRRAMSCVCWLVLILLLAVAGVTLGIMSQTVWTSSNGRK
jgi:hypothetical protein